MLEKHNHQILRQSAFPLTAIQVAGATSLPVLNSSIQLFHQYGFFIAFLILLVGNISIWAIAFTIVQMTANTTKNTLDNVRDYLGVIGSWTVGVVLLVGTIAYYVTQTNLTTETLLSLFPFYEGYQIDKFFQFGVAVGIASVLAIIEGIKGLKWVACISFPIILIAFVGLLIWIPKINPITLAIESSIGGLAIALGTSLGVAVDYPTFFQHSKSKKSSLFAVAWIQIITFFIGVGGLYLGQYVGYSEDISGWKVVIHGTLFLRALFLLLVFLSCLCVNTVNIYSASIAWELLAPKFLLGKKEYAILGLGLTIIFILTTGLISMQLLLSVSDIALANLCFVLVFGFVGKKIFGEPFIKEKWVFYFGWLVGGIMTVVAGLHEPVNLYLLFSGFLVSILTVCITYVMRKVIS